MGLLSDPSCWDSLLRGQGWDAAPPPQSLMGPAPWLKETRGSQCESGALWRAVKEKPGFTGGRRAACAKAQR